MGAILIKVREFAQSHGLIDVHFHKKWHKYDVYTAYKKDNEEDEDDPIYILIEGDHIRYATDAETERFQEGHDVYNDLPHK